MEKLFEIFCYPLTNSGRLPLSSSGATKSIRPAVCKCFLKWSKIFSGGHFPGTGLKVDFCLLVQEKCLSSSVDHRLIDLSSFCFKIFILKKNMACSLMLFQVFLIKYHHTMTVQSCFFSHW